MFVNSKIFMAKTIKGKFLEFLFGIILTLLMFPFLLLYIAGFYSGKLCGLVSGIEDKIVKGVCRRVNGEQR